jgi:hypothetical protein
MQPNGAISQRVIKLAMASMIAAIVVFWILYAAGINLRLYKSAGLVLGTGVLLNAIGCGFGDRLKSWMIVSLSALGTFLFAVGGNSIRR